MIPVISNFLAKNLYIWIFLLKVKVIYDIILRYQLLLLRVIDMLRIGFTGTRHGMSDVQKEEFRKLISAKDFQEFHHGMCEGSDEQAHNILIEDKQYYKIVGHPPKFTGSVALLSCNILMKADTYLKRNKNIVDATDILIATPDTKERPQSGTWSTVRYARKQGKRIYVIHKNGRVTIE